MEHSACVGETWFEYIEMNHLKRNESSSQGGFVAVSYVPLRSKNMTFRDGSPHFLLQLKGTVVPTVSLSLKD